MDDLISRNALLAAYDAAHKGPPSGARKLIAKAPAVDAVPVRRGRWVEIDDGDGERHYECSVCDEAWVLIDGTPAENNMNFCPRCGADMREGEKDG